MKHLLPLIVLLACSLFSFVGGFFCAYVTIHDEIEEVYCDQINALQRELHQRELAPADGF